MTFHVASAQTVTSQEELQQYLCRSITMQQLSHFNTPEGEQQRKEELKMLASINARFIGRSALVWELLVGWNLVGTGVK